MENVIPFLLSLISESGLSGFEEQVCKMIANQWTPLVDRLSVSPLGSLHGLRKAASNDPRPSLMIATHMDAIGLMAKQIEDGLIFLTKIGGVDPRILPGQQVTVHGRKDLPGIVQMLPDRLLDEDKKGKAPAFERLFVDTGLEHKELVKLVRAGDLISFAQTPIELNGKHIAGHSLDNRASVAALTVCLEEIRNFNLAWNVVAVATTREETSLAGAKTSAYGLRPDLAIVVDVTYAKGPGSNDYRTFPLGGGPTIGTGSDNHPALTSKFISLVEEMDMPYDIEAMPENSSTDGMVLSVTANGIPTIVVSVPLRYMHTTVEMVAVNDIERVGRLLARFITQLKTDSMTTLFEEENV